MPTPSPELIERYKALGAEKSYRVARLTGMTAHRVQIACSPASVSGKSTLESIDRAITKIEKAEAALGEVAKVTFSDPQPVSTAAAAPFTEDQVKLLDALKEQNHQEGHSCLTCGAPLDKDADHDIEQVFNWNVPGFYVQPLRFPVRFPNCRDQSKTGSVRPVSFWHGDPSTEEAQLIRVCLLDANPGMTVTVNTPDYPIMPNKLETWLGVTGIESWDHLRRKS